MGRLPEPQKAINARSRQIYDEPKFSGYEVTLDVWRDVFAYGVLLVPKDLKPGERRPGVVCQHGLEGRPVVVCVSRLSHEKGGHGFCLGSEMPGVRRLD